MSTNIVIPAVSSGAGDLFERWTRHRAEKRRRRVLRHTRSVLSDMTDHMLRDIGLSRDAIGDFDPASASGWRR